MPQVIGAPANLHLAIHWTAEIGNHRGDKCTARIASIVATEPLTIHLMPMQNHCTQIATAQHLAIWALDWMRQPAIINHSEPIWATMTVGWFCRSVLPPMPTPLLWATQNQKSSHQPHAFYSACFPTHNAHRNSHAKHMVGKTPPIAHSPFHSPPHARIAHIMACIMGTWWAWCSHQATHQNP